LPLVTALRTLGMPVYGSQPPTGYSAMSDAWVNTGALLGRLNFAVSLVESSRPRRRADGTPAMAPRAIAVDLDAIAADTREPSRQAVIDRFLGGDVSTATRATLDRAENAGSLVALALGSPEFQRR
jgi:uncharacterized protein (DUF1800 family)